MFTSSLAKLFATYTSEQAQLHSKSPQFRRQSRWQNAFKSRCKLKPSQNFLCLFFGEKNPRKLMRLRRNVPLFQTKMSSREKKRSRMAEEVLRYCHCLALSIVTNSSWMPEVQKFFHVACSTPPQENDLFARIQRDGGRCCSLWTSCCCSWSPFS